MTVEIEKAIIGRFQVALRTGADACQITATHLTPEQEKMCVDFFSHNAPPLESESKVRVEYHGSSHSSGVLQDINIYRQYSPNQKKPNVPLHSWDLLNVLRVSIKVQKRGRGRDEK